MKNDMLKSFKKFVHDETVAGIETNGSRVWKYMYHSPITKHKPKIHVVFSRYQHSEVNETIMGTAGYVLAIPSYWIDIDEDIVAIYVSSFIDAYINRYIEAGSQTNGSGDNMCGCENGYKAQLCPPIAQPQPPQSVPQEQPQSIIPNITYTSPIPNDRV